MTSTVGGTADLVHASQAQSRWRLHRAGPLEPDIYSQLTVVTGLLWLPMGRGRLGIFVVAVLALLSGTAVFVPSAGADEGLYAEFYTPPNPLPPVGPGDLIRTEPSRLVLEPSGRPTGQGFTFSAVPTLVTQSPMRDSGRSRCASEPTSTRDLVETLDHLV